MVVPLGPVFSERSARAAPPGFGLLLTALGTGMAVGVILLSAVQKRIPKATVFTASVLGAGISLFVAASMSTLPPAVLAILGTGHLRRRGVRARVHDPARDRRGRAAGPDLQRAVHARSVLPPARRSRSARCCRACSTASRCELFDGSVEILGVRRSACRACVSRCGWRRRSSSSARVPRDLVAALRRARTGRTRDL